MSGFSFHLHYSSPEDNARQGNRAIRNIHHMR
jgi:hypothetical protein